MSKTRTVEEAPMTHSTHIVVPKQVWMSLMNIVQGQPYREVHGTLKACEDQGVSVIINSQSVDGLETKG